jgi:predicted molibdopterin-dependent oxidoreductase YjgC
MIPITVDGGPMEVLEESTIREALAAQGVETPTICYAENLTPVGACRLCMVEVDGSRTLVASCSRVVEPGMVIATDSERVRSSRRLVLELLGSSVDLGTAPGVDRWISEYRADPGRFGDGATLAQPVKVQDDLYVRDYGKCVLCYKCVEACGVDAQNTFAISVAGRGFDATISTEFDVTLPDSACVYCGNCIGVCPTGALMFKTEFDMRADGSWDEAAQTVTETVCSFCGVGCSLELYVQDNRIVKVLSPLDHDITSGNLCIKGRFGWEHIQ